MLCQFAASLLLRRRLQPQARPCSQGGWSPRTSTPTTQSILSISAHQSVRNAAEEDARRSSKRRKYRRKKHHGEADASDTEADANDTEADASDTEAAERKGPRGSDGRATGVGRSAQAHVHVMSHGDHGSHDSEHGSPGQDASEAQQTQTPPRSIPPKKLHPEAARTSYVRYVYRHTAARPQRSSRAPSATRRAFTLKELVVFLWRLGASTIVGCICRKKHCR